MLQGCSIWSLWPKTIEAEKTLQLPIIAAFQREKWTLGFNYFVKNQTLSFSTVNYRSIWTGGRWYEEKTLAIQFGVDQPIFCCLLWIWSMLIVWSGTLNPGVGPSWSHLFYLQDLPVFYTFYRTASDIIVLRMILLDQIMTVFCCRERHDRFGRSVGFRAKLALRRQG